MIPEKFVKTFSVRPFIKLLSGVMLTKAGFCISQPERKANKEVQNQGKTQNKTVH